MKRCKKEKEALKPKVDAYNSIAADCSLPSVQFEEVCMGNMPWHDDQLAIGKSYSSWKGYKLKGFDYFVLP